MLYYAKNQRYWDMVEDIGQKEGEFIREHRPVLNTQIPKEDNWRKWEVHPVDARKVLKLLLEE